MIARSAWSCKLCSPGPPIHSPGTEEAFPTSQHPQALFHARSRRPYRGPRDVASAGKSSTPTQTASRIQVQRGEGRGERALPAKAGSRDLTSCARPGTALRRRAIPETSLLRPLFPAHPPSAAGSASQTRNPEPGGDARWGGGERCRPHRAGGSGASIPPRPRRLRQPPAPVSLPRLSTALRGVKATASWFLAGVVEPQSTRLPGKPCARQALRSDGHRDPASAPYGASPGHALGACSYLRCAPLRRC